MAESSLCKWMASFREEEPGCLPCRLSEVSSWTKVARRGIAAAVFTVAARTVASL